MAVTIQRPVRTPEAQALLSQALREFTEDSRKTRFRSAAVVASSAKAAASHVAVGYNYAVHPKQRKFNSANKKMGTAASLFKSAQQAQELSISTKYWSFQGFYLRRQYGARLKKAARKLEAAARKTPSKTMQARALKTAQGVYLLLGNRSKANEIQRVQDQRRAAVSLRIAQRKLANAVRHDLDDLSTSISKVLSTTAHSLKNADATLAEIKRQNKGARASFRRLEAELKSENSKAALVRLLRGMEA